MTAVASSPHGSLAALGRIGFAAWVVLRRLRRLLRARKEPMRIEELPDYLQADIGLRPSDMQMAIIRGRSRL